MAQLLAMALLLISFQASALSIEWIPLEAPEENGNISSIDGNTSWRSCCANIILYDVIIVVENIVRAHIICFLLY